MFALSVCKNSYLIEAIYRDLLSENTSSIFWRNDADTLARPALWRANVMEEAGLHVDCSADAGVGYRREYGDFHACQCGPFAAASGGGAGAADVGLWHG